MANVVWSRLTDDVFSRASDWYFVQNFVTEILMKDPYWCRFLKQAIFRYLWLAYCSKIGVIKWSWYRWFQFSSLFSTGSYQVPLDSCSQLAEMKTRKKPCGELPHTIQVCHDHDNGVWNTQIKSLALRWHLKSKILLKNLDANIDEEFIKQVEYSTQLDMKSDKEPESHSRLLRICTWSLKFCMNDRRILYKDDVVYTQADLFKSSGTRRITLLCMYQWFATTLVYYGLSLGAGSLGEYFASFLFWSCSQVETCSSITCWMVSLSLSVTAFYLSLWILNALVESTVSLSPCSLAPLVVFWLRLLENWQEMRTMKLPKMHTICAW